jgi:hypothetical protein
LRYRQRDLEFHDELAVVNYKETGKPLFSLNQPEYKILPDAIDIDTYEKIFEVVKETAGKSLVYLIKAR